MLNKPKKFTAETTPAQRLVERWNQQVFFISRKYPQAKSSIAAIMKAQSRKNKDFEPNEEALEKLADLYVELQQSPSL